MNKKIIFIAISLLLLMASIYAGYLSANRKECRILEHPVTELGSIVLYSEETEELYGYSEPMIIPQYKYHPTGSKLCE